MLYLLHCLTLLLAVFCPISKAQPSAVFDVRIDHHKSDANRDLVINTPRPRFSWKIDVSDQNVHQVAYQMQIQASKMFSQEHPFQWDSGRVRSAQSIHVPYTGPEDLRSSTYYRFRVRVWTARSEQASAWTKWIEFRTPRFDLHAYMTNNASLLWIGSTEINMNELRKEFNVPTTSPVKSAIVYITGLGYYEFYLNGNKVDPSRKLDPGWSTYEKRTLIASYDITGNITGGMNAVGVKLGNGWYSPELQGDARYGPPRLAFSLSILLESGEQVEVLSDLTWRGREGSIKHNSIYGGESYESRSDRPDWSRPGFNDSQSAWIVPESLRSPVNGSSMGLLVLQDMPPIRAGPEALHFEVAMNDRQYGFLTEGDVSGIRGASLADGVTLKPVDTWMSGSGLRVFDLGQNMAGVCRFRFRGPRGFGTYIRHAEILEQPVASTGQSTRDIYTDNLRNALATDIYVLGGNSSGEVYEPSFTVHGFRYLTVFGSPNALSSDDVECLPVHSETTLTGHFASSNPVINQIQHNVQWGQLSNLMSVPTDCPQRDERRGWMGDAALSVDEALYNFDLIKFYLNYLNLIVDMQLENGTVPDIVPGGNYPADPNWGSAFPTITWQLYRHYGDPKVLENYYDHVRAYVESLYQSYQQTGLVNYTFKYGDWLPPAPFPRTNEHLTTSFAFLHDLDLLINMSQVLGKTNDTTAYSTLYQQLAEEFHRVFFNSTTNFYVDGLQAAQVLALALRDVVPSNLRAAIIDYLVNDIIQNGNHSTGGIVSVARLYPLLSDSGHHDLALEMISSTTYPSYGYMFTNPYENATTLWELLNAPFIGPMSSRNHIMYGSVGAWFYSHLAGIDLSADVITIRPRMASEAKKHLMTKLDCQLSTLYGLVRVAYTRDTMVNSILLRVTIPANTRARIIFEPLFAGGQCALLLENTKVIWSINGTTEVHQHLDVREDAATGLMTVQVGSGQYEFQALWT